MFLCSVVTIKEIRFFLKCIIILYKKRNIGRYIGF